MRELCLGMSEGHVSVLRWAYNQLHLSSSRSFVLQLPFSNKTQEEEDHAKKEKKEKGKEEEEEEGKNWKEFTKLSFLDWDPNAEKRLDLFTRCCVRGNLAAVEFLLEAESETKKEEEKEKKNWMIPLLVVLARRKKVHVLKCLRSRNVFPRELFESRVVGFAMMAAAMHVYCEFEQDSMETMHWIFGTFHFSAAELSALLTMQPNLGSHDELGFVCCKYDWLWNAYQLKQKEEETKLSLLGGTCP
jgi:hypothetical protein